MKLGVGIGPGAAGSIECPGLLPSPEVHQGEEVAADPAGLRGHYALGCRGGDPRSTALPPPRRTRLAASVER